MPGMRHTGAAFFLCPSLTRDFLCARQASVCKQEEALLSFFLRLAQHAQTRLGPSNHVLSALAQARS